MKMKIHTFNMPMKHVFSISRRSFSTQKNIIVELSDQGHKGFGEATENPYYPNTDIATMVNALEAVRPIIETTELKDPNIFWNLVYPQLKEVPFAHCALDEAINDLFGKIKGKSLIELWGIPKSPLPISCYTLGLEEPDILLRRIKETPWPIYKIKLGGPKDLETIRILRQETDAVFRVDVNCAWRVAETIEKSHLLKELGVEFIEQPLPDDDWEGMEKVYQNSAVPLIADESCKHFSDIAKCVGRFHGINIKLMKCGGITPAKKMIEHGRDLGLKIMVGCMTESTIGLSAIGQFLPLLDYVDMDGALFLQKDIGRGVQVLRDKIILPSGNGTGAALIV